MKFFKYNVKNNNFEYEKGKKEKNDEKMKILLNFYIKILTMQSKLSSK